MSERFKPTFAHLLFAAVLIKVHDDVGCRGLKVRRWVVEGEEAVLADPREADIDRVLADECTHASAFGLWVAFAVDVMESCQWQREL